MVRNLHFVSVESFRDSVFKVFQEDAHHFDVTAFCEFSRQDTLR